MGSSEFTPASLNWENEIESSDGLDWEGDHGIAFFGQTSVTWGGQSISRAGQTISCRITARANGIERENTYRYRVRRDVISCEPPTQTAIECILEEDDDDSDSPGLSLPNFATAGSCCKTVPNGSLTGRLGRIVVAFPRSAEPTGTRISVHQNGAEVQAEYGSHSFELLPGTYEVNVGGKNVSEVTVEAGHDTTIRVGVLRVAGEPSRRAAVLEQGRELAGGYGGQLIGLPIGTFDVQIAGRTTQLTVGEGEISDL
jgi:hypothetical protein